MKSLQSKLNFKVTVQCIDIGNTNTHFGFYNDGVLTKEKRIKTKQIINNNYDLIHQYIFNQFPVSYCSVVPNAENSLVEFLKEGNFNFFNLNYKTNKILPIKYPNLIEIGQDRIANSLVAYISNCLPSIVIDIGTATTFDVIKKDEGYIGGVIAPGPQGYLDFLYQNTAQLPELKITSSKIQDGIGKSTEQAMQIGAKYGYVAMVKGIIDKISEELKITTDTINIISTGGDKNILDKNSYKHIPNLTLQGLAYSYLYSL